MKEEMFSQKANFSVLMSVYIKEKASYLHDSLESLLKQTVLPTEIVIVKDGPVTGDTAGLTAERRAFL